MRSRVIVLALAAAFASGRAAGQSLELSSDTTLSLRHVVVGPAAPVSDTGSAVTVGGLGPPGHTVTLPAGVNLDGFERTATGDVYFSTDVSAAIAGLPAPGVAGPGDVV